MWTRPGNFRWTVLGERFHHHVAPLAIDAANQLDVLVEEVIARHFVGHHLDKRRGVQVGALLELHKFGDHVWRRHNPSQTQSRRQGFRKRAQVNHVADVVSVVAAQVLPIEHDQRRKVLALIAELAIRIVLDDWDSIAVGQQNQFVAAAFSERRPARVLEVRQHVHELWPQSQRRFQLLGAKAVIVTRHAHVLRAIHIEGLQSSKIGGRFDQHAVTGVDQQLADQIQRLLRAGGDHHVLGLRLHAVPGRVARDHFPQRLVAFGRAVLEGQARLLVQDLVTSFTKALSRENLRGGQAAGKRNDFGVLSNLQELADGRAFDVLRALGVAGSPGG